MNLLLQWGLSVILLNLYSILFDAYFFVCFEGIYLKIIGLSFCWLKLPEYKINDYSIYLASKRRVINQGFYSDEIEKKIKYLNVQHSLVFRAGFP